MAGSDPLGTGIESSYRKPSKNVWQSSNRPDRSRGWGIVRQDLDSQISEKDSGGFDADAGLWTAPTTLPSAILRSSRRCECRCDRSANGVRIDRTAIEVASPTTSTFAAAAGVLRGVAERAGLGWLGNSNAGPRRRPSTTGAFDARPLVSYCGSVRVVPGRSFCSARGVALSPQCCTATVCCT